MAPRPPVKSQLRRGEKLARPIHPNVGLRAAYCQRMLHLIDDMHLDVLQEVQRQYKANPPATMAMDIDPVGALKRLMSRLSRRWLKKFDEAAPKLADWFATSVQSRSDIVLRRILRDGGMTVRFQASKGVKQAMSGAVGENVSLIKSIPSEYFAKVEQSVMRSAMKGGDTGALTRELTGVGGITKRRAAFIARDQNSKMTSVLVKERQKELGITHAIWFHSHGGHEPRPTHLAFDGHRYEIAKGAYLETTGGKMGWTWPGFEINCRCTCKVIIPGINDDEAVG
jgi:uncharacterized protein with gpF-like domain